MGVLDSNRMRLSVIGHEPTNEYSGHWEVASVASGGYGAGFKNPLASGKVYLVDQVWIGSAEACVLQLEMATALSGTDNNPEACNLRDHSTSGATTARYITNVSGVSSYKILTLPFYAGEKILLTFNGALKLLIGTALVLKKTSGTTGTVYMSPMWREESA